MLLLEEEEHMEGLALLQDEPATPVENSFGEIKSEIIQACKNTEGKDKFHNDTNLGLNFFLAALALVIGEVDLAYTCVNKAKARLVGDSLALLEAIEYLKNGTEVKNLKAKLLVSKSREEFIRILGYSIEVAEALDLRELKKRLLVSILAKSRDSFFSFLINFAEKYKEVFLESASLVDILLSPKQIKDNLLELGHIIRVWLQMPGQAIYFYDQALSIEQECEQGHFFMGLTLRVLGYPTQALRAYQRALELKPHFPDCLFNIGNLYLEELKDLDLAQSYYYKALALLEDYEPQPETSSAQMSESEPLIKEGNVYNALSELYRVKVRDGTKEQKMQDQSVEMLLNGIVTDPGFLDNYYDLSNELLSRDLEDLANLVQFSFGLFRTEEIKESVAFNNQLKRFKTLTQEIEERSRDTPEGQFSKRVVQALKKAFQFFDIKQCNSFEVFLEKLEEAVPS